MADRFHYGGQAVIEGVMMRGPRRMKVAVRRSDGEIVSHVESLGNFYSGTLRRKPFLRGFVVLVETLILGIKALLYSARVSAESQLEEEISPLILWLAAFLGILLGLVLFVAIPLLLAHFGLDRLTPSPILSNLADGLIRVIIFLLYLKGMTLIPDIRRVFAYHGAEHKTVNAYEAGAELRPEEVQKYSTAHVRCGTGFLLFVLVIAILAFVFLGRPALWLRFLSRLALLPLIAAVSYELIHLAADHPNNPLIRAILAPGLWLQRLTTRQPDEQQLEVAIEALEGVLEKDA
ncbi:MAG: DUF1385 domain-containing protein [Chloroflexi bacterium]|nr:MAG: DUF1385 domain-containing protein [Chloroflexota bacterium]